MADLIDVEVPPAMRRAALTLAPNLKTEQAFDATSNPVVVRLDDSSASAFVDELDKMFAANRLHEIVIHLLNSVRASTGAAGPVLSRRSKSFLAAEAIAAYVEAEAWQLDEIHAGLQELDKGRAVAHKDVSTWLRSWGKKPERKAPRA